MDNYTKSQVMKTVGLLTIAVGAFILYRGSKYDDIIDVEPFEIEIDHNPTDY